MTAGDVFSGYETVTNTSYCDIQPSGTREVFVHNIYFGGAVEFYISDGVSEFKFDSKDSYGCINFSIFHLTNSYYIRVKNVSGGSIDVAYDGIVSKE